MKILSNDGRMHILQSGARGGKSVKAGGRSFDEVLLSSQKSSSAPESGQGTPVEYTVKRGDTLSRIGKQHQIDPRQIAKDNNIVNPDMIHPGQKILLYQSNAGNPAKASSEKPAAMIEMTASWYGKEYHNKTAANGQKFDMYKNTLAHNSLPLGTRVRLVNPENGKAAEGVVTDRGPVIKGRDVDVSYALAKQLGFLNKGVTRLNVEILKSPATVSG